MIPAVHASGIIPGKGIQTFSAESERERLTPAALASMRGLAGNWKLTGEQMAGLLATSPSTWDRIAADKWDRSLNQDQMTRVSALVGIFKALHLLFADDMADRWPRLPNSGPLFGGKSPIEALIEGGIPTMLDVRRYIDGLRGGI